MSEEEKKAIGEIDISKTIESNIDYWKNKCFELQKEIEEKNKDIKKLNDLLMLSELDYISKDKIREKIEEIDKEYAEIMEKNKNNLEVVNINAQRHNAMQLILEELLEENKDE